MGGRLVLRLPSGVVWLKNFVNHVNKEEFIDLRKN